jgi:hypothetical protein
VVNTGLFGTKSSFVRLAQAFQSDNDVLVLYDKQLVDEAPRIDPDGHLFGRSRSDSSGTTTASTTTPTTGRWRPAGSDGRAGEDRTPRDRRRMTP